MHYGGFRFINLRQRKKRLADCLLNLVSVIGHKTDNNEVRF